MKSLKSTLILAATFVAVALTLGSCSAPKNITYLQDMTENTTLAASQPSGFRIEPGDKLSIVVHSKDPNLAGLFNLPIITNRRSTLSNGNSGVSTRNYDANDGMSVYTVAENGTIDFPVLGNIKISGMTRSEVVGFIKGELVGRDLIKDPTVIVEFLNTGISLLGEFNRPGRYDMNRDNITILEAISLGGDLTIQGMRENVKVIREMSDGTSKVYVVDLTNAKSMMESPAYYLKQSDVVYVEPTNLRKRQTTVNGNTALQASFWVSVASLLTSVAVLIFK